MIKIGGYAAIFNVPDDDRDIILPGAINAVKCQKMIYAVHDYSRMVGVISHMGCDSTGLWVEGRLIDDTDWRGLSIGYKSHKRARFGKRINGVETVYRILHSLDVLEISITKTPVHQLARFEVM